MGVTKKMLVGIKDGRQLKSGFVVPKPFFAGEAEGFISLETGDDVDRASVVYTGKSLSADDLLSKYLKIAEAPGDEGALRAFFDELLRKVKAAKLGSVVEVVAENQGDGFRLLQIDENFVRSSSDANKLP